MNPSSTPHNLKVDLFMPLEIGRYLQDTTHLDTLKSGAYLHLLMHYWTHGPLPNDPGELATIAKMTPDAWSIAYASLKHFFSIGSDGLLHQAGADRRLDYWIGKKLKAKEKATKAARARWDKHKAKIDAQSIASSIPSSTAQAMLEQCPISEVQEQKQKQKQKTPPTPTAGAAGDDANQADAPDAPSMQTSTAESWPPAIAEEVLEAGRELAAGILRGVQESINKAKTPEMAPAARPNGAEDVEPHQGREDLTAGHSRPAAGNFKKSPDPSKPDTRKKGFAGEISRFWQAQNPGRPKLRFTRADNRALNDLLRDHPEVTLSYFKQLLGNRARSEVNPAAAPHKWLRSILDFAAGPLSKFAKPMTPSRVIPSRVI